LLGKIKQFLATDIFTLEAKLYDLLAEFDLYLFTDGSCPSLSLTCHVPDFPAQRLLFSVAGYSPMEPDQSIRVGNTKGSNTAVEERAVGVADDAPACGRLTASARTDVEVAVPAAVW